jgi:PIN domain nuclease of toxin-antitoxin system
MNLLLDTHALLWWLDDSPKLSVGASRVIADGRNIVFVSAATIWETRIKQSLGKLVLPDEFTAILKAQPFEMLPITAEHAHAVGKLPPIHPDPFDRMLIAQAKIEKLALVTHNEHIKKYNLHLIEA